MSGRRVSEVVPPTLTRFPTLTVPVSTPRTSFFVPRSLVCIALSLTCIDTDGKNVKTDGKLPLPIDKDHKFAPVRSRSTLRTRSPTEESRRSLSEMSPCSRRRFSLRKENMDWATTFGDR